MLFKKIFSFKKKWLIKQYYSALNNMQSCYFSCYLQDNYRSERQLYELRIQHAHYRLFIVMQKLRNKIKNKDDIKLFENLYKITASFGSLRLRISDWAVLQVCKKEFSLITAVLAKILKNNSSKEVEHLDYVVDELVDLWQGALRITAPDPLVFLFFIRDLLEWKKTCIKLLENCYV